MLPKVSIITITYNHEKYILEALKSFLDQKYEGPIEIIIANDNSPDNTHDVITSFLANTNIPANFEIKYTKHLENKGMMSNFSWALQQATGEYIALCEGDDYWIDPLKLQKQVDLLEENKEITFVFHNCEIVRQTEEKNLLIRLPPTEFIESKQYSATEIFENWIIPTASVFFRNNYNRKKLISFLNHPNIIYADTLTFLTIAENGKIFGMADTMSIYRKHQEGVSNCKIDEQKFINHLNQIINFFGSNFNTKKIKTLKSLYYFKKFDRQKKANPLVALYCLFASLFLDKNHFKKYLQKKIK